MAAVAQSIKRLLPKKLADLPPILKPGSGNLYEVLSRTPSGGVGSEVHQTRWSHKNINDCYWLVTRSVFKGEGTHGKAWGHLFWRGTAACTASSTRSLTEILLGKQVSSREERIRGSLKYNWKEGRSIIGNKDLIIPSKTKKTT